MGEAEHPWGALPQLLCLCSSQGLNSEFLQDPFLGGSLGWALCSRMELQAQPIVHSPSHTGLWA